MTKRLLLLATALLLNLVMWAQAPHVFTYQAVVRNAQGVLVSNSDVSVRIAIIQGSEDGPWVYTEQHTVHTNQHGLFTLNIGQGNEGLVAIDWQRGPYYIRTEVDPTGGNNYSLSTVQQLMSVPYALHAYSVDTVISHYDETDPLFSAWDKDYNDLINKPAIPTVPTNVSAFVNDAGYLTSYTESQILSISNDTIYLTGGSFVKLPAGFSGDYNDLTNTPTLFSGDYNDLTNTPTLPVVPDSISAFINDAGYLTSYTESQILSISNDTIYLTGGSFVKLPAGFSGDYNDLTNTPTLPLVPDSISAFINDAGYLTSYTEIQVLSISNDTIYLTGGSFVKLPAGFSGDYNDLTNTPTLPVVPDSISAFVNDAGYLTSYTESQILSISNDTIYLTGGSFVKLPAGFSGDYNDLTNTPTLFSGDYNDLINKPNIAAITGVPDSISAFVNDAGYLAAETDPQFNAWNKDYSDLTNRPNIGDSIQSRIDTLTFLRSYTETDPQFNAWNKDYSDLTNRPNIGDSIRNSIDTLSFMRNYTETDPLFTAWNKSYNDLTNRPNIGDSIRNSIDTLSFIRNYTETDPLFTAWNKDYSDLTNRPNIGDSIRNSIDTLTFIRNYTETDPQFTAWNKSYNDLTNRPNIGDSIRNSIDTLSFIRNYTETDPLFTAWNKSYNDLTNRPNIGDSIRNSIDTLTFIRNYTETDPQFNAWNKSYNDLTNRPNIGDSIRNSIDTLSFIRNYTETDPQFTAWNKDYTTLNNKPTIPTSTSQLTNDAGFLSAESQILSIIDDTIFLTGGSYVVLPAGFSGDYNDLTNLPTMFSGSYNDLTDKPPLFSGSYNDLTDKPNLFSGNYNDLTNKPNLFSGDYNDLTNQPDLFSGDYNDLTNQPSIVDTIRAYQDTAWFLQSEDDPIFYQWLNCGWNYNYEDLTNKPNIQAMIKNYLDTTTQFVRTETDPLFTAWDKDYNDLINRPTIPTSTSQLTNDAGFITSYTESQTLEDVAAEGNAVNTQIKSLSDPTDPMDAVNKRTVEAIIAELRHYYDSVIDYQRRVIDTLASTATGDLAFNENGSSKSVFTINSSGDQVRFSRGNLQYYGNALYRFADNQYDVLGTSNTPKNGCNNGSSAPAEIARDLFVWGSGLSISSNGFWTGYTGTYTQDQTNGWGRNSMAIVNGDYTHANVWRTLSYTEWSYVLFTRSASSLGTTPSARWVGGSVNGIFGMFIFPDLYVHPADVPVPTNINSYTLNNNYTIAQFRKMEMAGVIFLPAAGYMYSGKVYGVNNNGWYWSTSYENENKAKYMKIIGSGVSIPSGDNRNVALPVRLVMDVTP